MAVAALESRARAAESLTALAFSIVNDPHPLLGFRQALAFDCSGPSWELLAVSGLAKPTEDSPYLVWLRAVAKWLEEIPMPQGSLWLTQENDLPEEIASGWSEWWPAEIWCISVVDRNKQPCGMVIYQLDAPPPAELAGELLRLNETWSYCWSTLTHQNRSWHWRPTAKQRKVAALVLAVFCLLPVRQTALAPAEVVALDAIVVASPLDGVIKTFHVRPNQPVKKGELLYSLDDTTLRNRLEVTLKGVAVADAELNAASQRSFDAAPGGRNEIALLTGRSQERRAELTAIQTQLSRVDVPAPRDGVAVFGDPNDWIGKPVVTGERIMLLADPATPAMLINLPVADAIALEAGAPVKLYLSAHPLSSIEGKITETSYQAITTPEGVSAYRLRASIEGPAPDARLGLRGTAKVSGGWVVLGYYLLRRPLAAARAWSGL